MRRDVPNPHEDPSSAELGACFGYAVRSSVPWSLLRPGTGTPLTVSAHANRSVPGSEPLLVWHDGGVPVASLFADARRYVLDVAGIGCYEIDPDAPSISVPEEAIGRIELRLWGIPVALCRIGAGDHVLHASTVDVGGQAIAFAAPGGYGKTTLASAFFRAGHRLLGEDLVACRPATETTVWPGAAGVRLRRDVYERLELPGTTVLAEDAETVQVSIEPALRGDASAVPLRAIVLLRKSEDDGVMTPVPPGEALRDLWAVSLRVPTDEDRARCFRGVGTLAAHVPVWNFSRRLTFENLPATVERIVAHCLG